MGWKIQSYTKKTFEIMLKARSVIVLGYHVWDDIFEVAVKSDGKWIYPEYFPLKFVELKVIHYLRMKGFNAVSVNNIFLKTLAKLDGFGNFGKNSLITNPIYGPWLRFAAILTDAALKPDKPFEDDLCGDCEECIKACPVNVLTPYKVDDEKSLVGIHLNDSQNANYSYIELFRKYEPSITRNSHLMCMECQKACKYGRELHF